MKKKYKNTKLRKYTIILIIKLIYLSKIIVFPCYIPILYITLKPIQDVRNPLSLRSLGCQRFIMCTQYFLAIYYFLSHLILPIYKKGWGWDVVRLHQKNWLGFFIQNPAYIIELHMKYNTQTFLFSSKFKPHLKRTKQTYCLPTPRFSSSSNNVQIYADFAVVHGFTQTTWFITLTIIIISVILYIRCAEFAGLSNYINLNRRCIYTYYFITIIQL